MNFLIIILLTTFYCVYGDFGLKDKEKIVEKPYCFHFSFATQLDNQKKRNCSDPEYKNIPCIQPFQENFPNYTHIWATEDRDVYGCVLDDSLSCIKYTYLFHNAVVNRTHYCGKMILDNEKIIENGCYTEMKEGYQIEACVCRTRGLRGEIPCNSSTRSYSISLGTVLMLLLTLIYK